MTESFDLFKPTENIELTDEESDIFDCMFGKNDKSSSSSSHYDEDDKDDDNNNNEPLYDCAYGTIIFAIILTLVFLVLACPAVNMCFSWYIPDPYFRLITIALIFFIIVFIFDLVLSRYGGFGKRHHGKF